MGGSGGAGDRSLCVEEGVQKDNKRAGAAEEKGGGEKKSQQKMHNTKVGFNLVGGRKFL